MGPLRSLCALRALWTLWSLITLRTRLTLRSLCALGSLRSLRSLWTLVPLITLRALRSYCPNCEVILIVLALPIAGGDSQQEIPVHASGATASEHVRRTFDHDFRGGGAEDVERAELTERDHQRAGPEVEILAGDREGIRQTKGY